MEEDDGQELKSSIQTSMLSVYYCANFVQKVDETIDPRLQNISEPIGTRKIDGTLDVENFNYSSKSVTDKAV
jgi:hypothetical protein